MGIVIATGSTGRLDCRCPWLAESPAGEPLPPLCPRAFESNLTTAPCGQPGLTEPPRMIEFLPISIIRDPPSRARKRNRNSLWRAKFCARTAEVYHWAVVSDRKSPLPQPDRSDSPEAPPADEPIKRENLDGREPSRQEDAGLHGRLHTCPALSPPSLSRGSVTTRRGHPSAPIRPPIAPPDSATEPCTRRNPGPLPPALRRFEPRAGRDRHAGRLRPGPGSRTSVAAATDPRAAIA